MTGLKLNLGSGRRPRSGYVNVDKSGTPDVRHDLETFPWPWPDNSVDEIVLRHVLQQLGRQPSVFLGIMKEMYRVCRGGARVLIGVPHFRADSFVYDPLNVRPITPDGLALFSKRVNRECADGGFGNSPLGIYLDVDFELVNLSLFPSQQWFRLHPGPEVDMELLQRESKLYNNLIDEVEIELRVLKGAAP